MQLLVSEGADLTRLALPNDRGFIFAPGFDVPVQAVVREIELAADKPLRPRAIPFQNFVPLLEPVQFAGNARPEFVGLLDRFFIEMLILIERLDVGLLGKLRRTRELALLIQNGIDIWTLGIDNALSAMLRTSTRRNYRFTCRNPSTRSQEFILHIVGRDVTTITWLGTPPSESGTQTTPYSGNPIRCTSC